MKASAVNWRRTAAALAAAYALFASAPAFAALCNGDCDGDGLTSRDEIVLGVRLALGESSPAMCAAFGNATVELLVRAVADLLQACGPAPDLDQLTGTYDAQVVQTTEQARGAASHQLAIAGADKSGGLSISVEQNLYAYVSVAALPSGGQNFTVEGFRIDSGDLFFDVSGTAVATIGEESVLLELDLTSEDFFGNAVHIVASLARPKSGTPSSLSGSYLVTFDRQPNPGLPFQSSAVLPVQVPPSGIGFCGPATEVSGGETTGSIGESRCYLSPRGLFYFASTYQAAGEGGTAVEMQNYELLGELDANAETSGQYLIGLFPGPFELSIWHSSRSEIPSP